MSRRRSNNPSGRFLQMSDEQYAKYQASFERAVARQRERDEAAAAEGKRRMAAAKRRRQAQKEGDGGE